jgi:hypothetical protein
LGYDLPDGTLFFNVGLDLDFNIQMIWKSDLQRQINEMNERLKKIESMDFRIEFGKLQTEVISMRGLINRKFGSKTERENASDENSKYGNPMCLPE